LFWFLINHARKDYLILEKGMLFFALGTILMAVLYMMNIGVEYEGGRLSMFQENENTVGINMSIGIIILLMNVIQNRLKLGMFRFLLLIPVPVMINFVLSTGSRLAFISMVFSILAITILIKTDKKINKLIIGFLGILILFVIGIWLLEHEILRDRLFKTVEEGDLAHRDVIWRKLLPLIKENPIFGVGNTGYSAYSLFTFGLQRSPHNVIIEVICLTGFSGLLLYLIFLVKILWKGYSCYLHEGFLLPVLLAIPVVGAILSGQILTRKIGWVIFAYILGSTALKKIVFERKTILKKNSNAYTVCN
jgi:O-antigen ligase